MNNNTFDQKCLPKLLPLYYTKLFPSASIKKWLSYDDPSNFAKREISLTRRVKNREVYVRYQSYNSVEEFVNAIQLRLPIKIDIGAIYAVPPYIKNAVKILPAVEKEVVFDIDISDYDQVRTCCSGAETVCPKCWKFMIIACKIIDSALREDFAFKNMLWLFSGRRGVHCWVCDSKARHLNNRVRSAIAEYLTVIKGSLSVRKVQLKSQIHHSLQRALGIINEYFEPFILVEQDILGTDARLNKFLSNIEEKYRVLFREPMQKFSTTQERWQCFKNTAQELLNSEKLPTSYEHIVDEFILYYTYPRLDIHVTKSLTHLLKCPFCVHPKTGKIAVPFNIKNIDNFDPEKVPTISQLADQIIDKNLNSAGVDEYMNTELRDYVDIFEEFLICLVDENLISA